MAATRAQLWPAVAVASGALAVFADLGHLPVPLRPLLVAWFVAVCPGMAWVSLLRLRDRLSELVIGVATSLVVATLATEAMALAHRWSPSALLVALAVACVPAVVLSQRSGRRTPASTGADLS